MNAVHFKYKDQTFTLDLDAGKLQGTVTPAKKEIEDALEQAKGGYLGAGYLPIPPPTLPTPTTILVSLPYAFFLHRG